MKKVTLLTALLLFSATLLNANQRANSKELLDRMNALKETVRASRDSLQWETAERWRVRQESVRQREKDKQEIGALNDLQSEMFNRLTFLREEKLAAQRRLESAQADLRIKQDEWRYTRAVINDIFGSYADRLSGSFPVRMEQDRLELENIRSTFSESGNAVSVIKDFQKFVDKRLVQANAVSFESSRSISDQGETLQLMFARFGNVFGYGLEESGEFYFVRQTGRMGHTRYSVAKVETPVLERFLRNNFFGWIDSQSINGPVLVDILQNEHSSALVQQKAISLQAKAGEFFRSGGPVMYPLITIPLYALILVFIKIFHLGGKLPANRKIVAQADKLLDNRDIEGLKSFLESKKSMPSKVGMSIVTTIGSGREAAEDVAKEILLAQTSSLGRHLNTLAVLAAVAPLMGLLGTVTGMITLFDVITTYGTGDPKLLAGGISQALVTTETGLIIAVPILLAHNFLRNKKTRIVADLQCFAMHLINRLSLESDNQ